MSKTIINAPNAELRTNIKSGSAPNFKRNSKPRRGNRSGNKVPQQQQQVSAASVGSGLKPHEMNEFFRENASLTECGQGWVHAYIDPCGVHGSGLDIKRVGDGAMPISAMAEFRFLDTITLPFNEAASVDVSGRNFSLLILQLPIMRALSVIVCHIRSREFDTEVMTSFSRAFANIPSRESAYYPKWVPCDLSDTEPGVVGPVLFFTVIAPSALKAIQEPNEAGISTLLNQFRYTSYGVELDHNTPTLYDQGTFVTACFNCSVEPFSYVENHVRGFDPFYLNSVRLAPTLFDFTPTISGVQAEALSALRYIGSLPSPEFTLDFTLRNGSGSVVFQPGDVLEYVEEANAVRLRSTTTGVYISVGSTLLNLNNQTRLYARVALIDALTEQIVPNDGQLNKLILPPVTQADIQQMNVSAVHGLLKDCRGGIFHKPQFNSPRCYLPNRIWRPIFDPQDSNNFRKCIIVNDEVPLADLVDPTTGWSDSFDRNFGWGVMNLQSVPWAAAPFLHAVRSDEQVPGHNSIIGAYATKAGYKEQLALDVALTASSRLPHGSIAATGVGGLFDRIDNMLAKLPRVLASGSNVAVKISELIDKMYS